MFKCKKCEECKYDNNERNYKLYVHISPSNKGYYGITSEERVEKRWQNGKGYMNNVYFTRAINKYGWDNFKHIVLFDNLTKEEACLLEQCYIKLYDTTNRKYGYNIDLGGNVPSMETREKISDAQKGKHPTEETKKKLSEALKGENNPNYGKGNVILMFTKEGQFIRRFDCAANANEYLGKNRNNQHIKMCARGNKDVKDKFITAYGYIWIYEKDYNEQNLSKRILNLCYTNQLKMSKDNTNSKPVLMFTKDGEFIRKFDSVVDANKYLGKPINMPNIYRCAKAKGKTPTGKTKTAYGYIWIYEEDYIKEQEQDK